MADEPNTTTTTTPTAWTASLPETIRGNAAWADVPDVGTLATKYLETRRPFAEQLPKDISGEAVFKDLKDLDGLARSYHGQAKLLGVPKDQLLRLPVDDKPESWAPIYNKLGRPETPDGYKLSVPEGQTIDEGFSKSLYAKAHELGVGQKQLDGLYGWLRESGGAAAKAQAEAATLAQTKAGEGLKTEWGQAYESKLTDAKAAIAHLDKTLNLQGSLAKDLEATNLGNHPGLAKALAHLAANFREDGLIGKAGGDTLASPVEAKQNIAALQQDKAFMAAYMDRANIGHAAAVEKMRLLYEQATPRAA